MAMASSLQAMIRPYVITLLCLLIMVMIKTAKSEDSLIDNVCSGDHVDSIYCHQLYSNETDTLGPKSNLTGLAGIALHNINWKAAYNKRTFIDKDAYLSSLCSVPYDHIVSKVATARNMGFDKSIETGDVNRLEETITTVLSEALRCESFFLSPEDDGYEINEELIKLAYILQENEVSC
ncbi:unnamed protein product [Linum trigynum]|uniref:Pectinesterase inhibitor domain-containing protein n=1 Tax=Linum trigynum TaxID=586398 RepID=A0AAV2DKT7_9ROSI